MKTDFSAVAVLSRVLKTKTSFSARTLPSKMRWSVMQFTERSWKRRNNRQDVRSFFVSKVKSRLF
jgi:hypothetical protein